MKEKILILGGAGFIGVNLIEHFLQHNHDVIVYGRTKPLGFEGRITFVEANLTDINEKKEYLKSLEIDTAIYLINSFSVNSKVNNYQALLDENKYLINEIFDLVERFIFFSSGGRVYKSSERPHHEDEHLEAVCDYGKSKIALETFVTKCGACKKKKFLIVRPSNPYGPHQTLTGNQGLIAVLTGRIISGQVVDVWGSGNEVRDYIYIRDFAKIFYALFCVKNPRYNVYNIGSCTGESTLSILTAVRRCLPNYNVQLNYIPNDTIIKSNILCNKRVLEEIGVYNYTDINSGIAQFVEWLQITSRNK
ncbi:NAD-dependent epimerase/dehydratase family protein [Enterobacter sp. RHBSTW-00901]|uniref:NAD-dependent epimerase/dehydratase family protein n=1 Tax=Enterobacter sp. RHBSTW-00901 TaxID=2742669 RepID=UPI0015F52021|nr:NAD-dependent epimerase/dehydratase family protein [Enterobacter sp. RHBSTW-00901]MBA7854551.1 NAD-dependent epimerase/dehydratase family protein [Enterobacter sp. RHBSTW-00901]